MNTQMVQGSERASDSRLPNLVIAGVYKAATTSLFMYLSAHEDVCASRIKETRYFRPLSYGRDLKPFAEYRKHFLHCGNQRYVLEATPGYFYGGRDVAEAIKAHLPDARILIVLRDPVSRLFSFYKFMKSCLRLEKNVTLEEYIRACEALPPAERRLRKNIAYWGIEGGLYADYMDTWFDVFGAEDVRVLFFENLKQDIPSLLSGVCEWLDLDPSPLLQRLTVSRENRTVGYRSRLLQRLALKLNRRGEAFWREHPPLKRALRKVYYVFNGASYEETMSDGTRAYLNRIYEPYNVRLAAQLSDRGYSEFPGWLSRHVHREERERANGET